MLAIAVLWLGCAVPPAAAQSDLRPGDEFRDCPDCPLMVVLPAGGFQMGSAGGDGDERPPHWVAIAAPFAVAKFEVTVRQWARFARDGGYAAGAGCWTYEDGTWSDRPGRSWRAPGFAQADEQPAVCLNWHDARAYAAWLARRTGRPYRLLSEAEWEYAARAGTRTAFHWGTALGLGNANCDGCGSAWDDRQTAPVGRFAANDFGLHDMHGNVSEWVEDCWHGGYRGAPSDGSARQAVGGCASRALRGGSWSSEPSDLRASYRDRLAPESRDHQLGFRIARSLE